MSVYHEEHGSQTARPGRRAHRRGTTSVVWCAMQRRCTQASPFRAPPLSHPTRPTAAAQVGPPHVRRPEPPPPPTLCGAAPAPAPRRLPWLPHLGLPPWPPSPPGPPSPTEGAAGRVLPPRAWPRRVSRPRTAPPLAWPARCRRARDPALKPAAPRWRLLRSWLRSRCLALEGPCKQSRPAGLGLPHQAGPGMGHATASAGPGSRGGPPKNALRQVVSQTRCRWTCGSAPSW